MNLLANIKIKRGPRPEDIKLLELLSRFENTELKNNYGKALKKYKLMLN